MAKFFVNLVADALATLLGAWLMVAPFALRGFQPAGGAWTSATNWTFYFGLGITLLGVIGAILQVSGMVALLYAKGALKRPVREAPKPAVPPQAAVPDNLALQLEQQLRTERELSALLNELIRERQGRSHLEPGRDPVAR